MSNFIHHSLVSNMSIRSEEFSARYITKHYSRDRYVFFGSDIFVPVKQYDLYLNNIKKSNKGFSWIYFLNPEGNYFRKRRIYFNGCDLYCKGVNDDWHIVRIDLESINQFICNSNRFR